MAPGPPDAKRLALSSEDRMLVAQPAVVDALEVAEDPVAMLGEDRELGAVLLGLVESRFAVFAEAPAGNPSTET
jgi:hypothetical protein